MMKKDFICISCKQIFDLKGFKFKDTKLKFPVLLECGHTICYSCMKKKLKAAQQNNCEECGFTLMTDTYDLSNKMHCINYYIVGYLMTSQSLKNEKNKNVKYLTPKEANFHYNLEEKKNDLMLKFDCKECNTEVCPHCVTLKHEGQGHHIIKLEEKSEETIELLKKEVQEVQLINEKMENSIKSLLCLSEKESEIHENLKCQISQNFGRLHGILQLEEEKLLQELDKAVKDRKNCVNDICELLKNQMEIISELLDQWNKTSNNSKVDDLIRLRKSLIKVKKLPNVINFKNFNNKIKINFEEAIVNSLQNYCTLKIPSLETKNILLIKENDAFENYIFEPGKKNLNDKNNLNIMNDHVNISADSEPSTIGLEFLTKELIEKRSYSVYVTYIKHPEEFYVTLISMRTKQKLINKIAWEATSFSDKIPVAVTKDKIYLLKGLHEKKSYRVRIVEVFSNTKNEIMTSEHKDQVLVYFLDYGHSKKVSISSLRSIPENLLTERPLAIKCKLFDCVPKDEKWCQKSVEIMKKILGRGAATMFIMKTHPDFVEVDLRKFDEENKVGSEIVSVRDALIFLEFTKLVTGEQNSCYSEKYSNQILPALGDNFEIIISHINTASDFYIQKLSPDLNYLHILNKNLQASCRKNLEKGLIYNPKIGMPCAALFSGDQNWYRAKIVEISGNKKLKVFYVDYGNEEILEWTSIRKIKKNFIKIPPLALNCSLAKTESKNNDFVSFDVLSQHFSRRNYQNDCREKFYAKILEKNDDRNKLQVSFYQKKTNSNYLNQIVDENKKYCRKLLFHQNHQKLQTLSVLEDNVELNTGFKFKDFVNGKDFISTIVEEKMKSMSKQEQQLQHLSDLSSKFKLDGNETRTYLTSGKDIFKAKVVILSAASPSLIYLTLPELLIKLEKLQGKINEFYKNSLIDNTTQWTVGSQCAVYCSKKKMWFRASIIEFLTPDTVKVFAMDVAKIFTASVFSLRLLDFSFLKHAACSIKCHLGDICPPSDMWPATSCEFLKTELDTHKEIYLTRKGEINTSSLPIELWVEKVIPGSALDPITREWVCLNKLLVNKGLAIPLQQKKTLTPDCGNKSTFSASSITEKSDNNEKTIVGFVTNNFLNNKSRNVFIENFSIFHSVNVKWLAPDRLKNSSFIGMPTYVDFDGTIYIYDVEKDANKLNLMRQTLMEKYEKSKPDDENELWRPGDLCIVKYQLDKFWYRGTVIKVNDNLTNEVLFVDYGNVETCKNVNMRKNIEMIEIPLLTHKFLLQGIKPASKNQQWPVKTIDFLHGIIVDKKCQVKVLDNLIISEDEESIENVYMASLTIIETNIEVAPFLVDKGLALFCNTLNENINSKKEKITCSSIQDFDTEKESTTLSSFNLNSLNIPFLCSKFRVKINYIKSENEVFATILDDESLASDLRQILNSFEKLNQELQEQCEKQPFLRKFVQGQLCCVNSKKRGWRRAEIISYNENLNSVCVVYIDNGNKEYVKKKLIRQCKNKWLDIPKMAIKLTLFNVKMSWSSSKGEYMRALKACFQNNPLLIEVIKREGNNLEVNVLNEKNNSLVYSELITNGLMIRCEKNF